MRKDLSHCGPCHLEQVLLGHRRKADERDPGEQAISSVLRSASLPPPGSHSARVPGLATPVMDWDQEV